MDLEYFTGPKLNSGLDSYESWTLYNGACALDREVRELTKELEDTKEKLNKAMLIILDKM